MSDNERILAAIEAREFHEVIIDDNDHKEIGYTTEQQIETMGLCGFDADDYVDSLEACIAADSLCSVQIYPSNSVGFYIWFGSSLNVCLKAVEEWMEDE